MRVEEHQRQALERVHAGERLGPSPRRTPCTICSRASWGRSLKPWAARASSSSRRPVELVLGQRRRAAARWPRARRGRTPRARRSPSGRRRARATGRRCRTAGAACRAGSRDRTTLTAIRTPLLEARTRSYRPVAFGRPARLVAANRRLQWPRRNLARSTARSSPSPAARAASARRPREALVRQGARVGIGDLDVDLAAQVAEELGGGAVGLRAQRQRPRVVRALPGRRRGRSSARSTSSSTTPASCRSARSTRRTTRPRMRDRSTSTSSASSPAPSSRSRR